MVALRAMRDRPLFAEINLDRIEEHLTKMEVGNVDVTIPAQHINYTPEGFIKVGDQTYGMSTWSFRQMAKLLGRNAKDLREAPTGTGPATKYAIVNYWLSKMGDKPLLLRLKETGVVDEKTGATGRVRAIMSTGGKIPFSARDLLSALRPYLRQYNMAVQMGNATERSFHVRTLFREGIEITTPKLESKVHVVPTGRRDLDGGVQDQEKVHGDLDTHTLGVHWRMSEVGFCPLTGDLVVYRLICQNGMIGLTEKTSIISRRLALVDEGEFRTEIGMGIEKARERQNEMLERLTALRDYKLSDPVSELKSWLGGRADVNKEFISNAEAAFREEPINSKYGVLQAITRAAKKYHPDQRVVLETIAGIYLETSLTR